MVDRLEDTQLVSNVLEGLVVVGLQGNLLHGHYIAGLVVYGSVDFPKMTLANLDSTLPGEANKPCLDVDSVFGLGLVQHLAYDLLLSPGLLPGLLHPADAPRHSLFPRQRREGRNL